MSVLLHKMTPKSSFLSFRLSAKRPFPPEQQGGERAVTLDGLHSDARTRAEREREREGEREGERENERDREEREIEETEKGGKGSERGREREREREKIGRAHV